MREKHRGKEIKWSDIKIRVYTTKSYVYRVGAPEENCPSMGLQFQDKVRIKYDSLGRRSYKERMEDA